MQIKIKDLGLAAYLEIQSRIQTDKSVCPLFKSYDENSDEYVFDDPSGKSIDQWRAEYYSDRCSVHDDSIMRLRKFKHSRRR